MSLIDRVEVMAIGPDVPRTTWASMPPQLMTLIIAKVWDSDGAMGIGATETYSSGAWDLSTYEAIKALSHHLLGKEASNIEARWHDLQLNVSPAPSGSVAALDIALWDLASTRCNLPLSQYIGGVRDSIRAYASTAQLDSVEQYVSLVHDLREEGFRAIKFHAWNVPSRDLEMLEAISERYYDSDITFMHDAENRYDFAGALKVGRALERMGFAWFEAPFRDYDVHSYRRLRSHLSIPLVPHGLWLQDLQEIGLYLSQHPWDAVRFDATMVGGITVARKVCALAEAFGLPVEPQSWGYSLIQAANLHVGLSTKSTSYFELPVPYAPYEFGIGNPIRCDRQGMVRAPGTSGLGLEVDWDAMTASALDVSEIRL